MEVKLGRLSNAFGGISVTVNSSITIFSVLAGNDSGKSTDAGHLTLAPPVPRQTHSLGHPPRIILGTVQTNIKAVT